MNLFLKKKEVTLKTNYELPRNSSKTRIKNRCVVTGEPKEFIDTLKYQGYNFET